MMEKKRTNSGPFMESTGKHSIYPRAEGARARQQPSRRPARKNAGLCMAAARPSATSVPLLRMSCGRFVVRYLLHRGARALSLAREAW
jgi:hypothetical protein